jgi:hypothetical protein
LKQRALARRRKIQGEIAMNTKFGSSGLIVCGLIAGALLAGRIAGAADAPPGERWRQTQSMEMMGMQMPGQTLEFCKEPGTDTLPVKPDKNCTMHDVTRSASGAAFKMTCTGEHAAEAEGQTTFLGPDHMRTQMHMKMAEGEMTMNIESQKIGPCTGSEINFQVKKTIAKAQADAAAAQAEAARNHAQMCAEAAQKADSPMLMEQQCKDPATIKTYCANFQTHEAFRKQADYEAQMGKSGVSNAQTQPLTTSAKLCNVDVAQLRTRLCGTAESQGQMAFIATQCVALAGVIAARECTGRSYTSLAGSPYYPICASFASGAAGTPGATAPPPPPTEEQQSKANAISKGKKILGGLLGH